MSNERRRGFIRGSNQTDDLMEAWALPSYEAEHEDPHATAINFDPKWKPKPLPSDTSEDILPNHLTAAELDDICQSAVEEGKLEGYSQGFEQGQSEGFSEGKTSGFESGHQEGYEQALTDGKKQIVGQCQQLEALIEKLAQPIAQVNQQVLNQMLDLVIHVSRSVTQTEVKTNPQVILNTLKEAVEALPQVERTVSIYLHPHDLAVIQSAYGVAALADRDWRLIDDPSLNIGDIQVACVDSRIDYRIEDRIAQCFQRFLSQNTSLDHASSPASSVLLDAEKQLSNSSLSEHSAALESDSDGLNSEALQDNPMLSEQQLLADGQDSDHAARDDLDAPTDNDEYPNV